MWVSGAPGVGKSALLQTICEMLSGSYSPIGASFFFGRGQGFRELACSLAPTIAYQFTRSSVICRWCIWRLQCNNPGVLHETLESQFRKLVTQPASTRSYVQSPLVVVIDGLDECNSVQDRVTILKLIFEAASTKSIRFLISSRPEEEIENFFNQPDVYQHVEHVILDEATFKTSKDIKLFLRYEFARIRRSRPDAIPLLSDGQEWPGDCVIDELAAYSDAQFLLPVLAIGFLDEELFSPHEQLEALLNPPTNVSAFSKLDHLYNQILTRRPRHLHQADDKFVRYQAIVKGILHVVVAWPERLSIVGMAAVLAEEVHVVQNVVRGPLRTLFKFEGSVTDSHVAFCHKSLDDCLSDIHRSGEFHVPENALDLLYLRILSRPPPLDPSLTFLREQLVGVLCVVAVWPWQDGLTVRVISLVLDVELAFVENVVRRSTSTMLLHITEGGEQ